MFFSIFDVMQKQTQNQFQIMKALPSTYNAIPFTLRILIRFVIKKSLLKLDEDKWRIVYVFMLILVYDLVAAFEKCSV